jgi:dTDP-4-dehydrorhamnose reductase/UDP-glucose 4-epimerase
MSAAETVVVGRSSLLARGFASRHADAVLRVIGHAQAGDGAAYQGARCVVNFAFAPVLEQGDYDAAQDVDARVATQAARLGLHYVMISSRRVYPAAAQWNASEASPAGGMDAYGRNKSRIESMLRAQLGDRLTVLRPGNVLALEPVAGRRRFGAYLQQQLVATGRIRLTVDPEARRDLVPVDFFCSAVRAAIERRLPGTYNLGAGGATRVGDAARWLIAGYGRGSVEVAIAQPRDEFQLDSTRLQDAFGLRCEPGAVEAALRELGRALAQAA